MLDAGAEVCELDPRLEDQDVLGLDVSVDDWQRLGVEIVDGEEDFEGELGEPGAPWQ